MSPDEYLPTSGEVYCVPFLVRHAAHVLAGEDISLREISVALDIRVRPTDPNPWRLAPATDDVPAGITLRALSERLPPWLEQRGLPLRYEYQPWETMPWGDGELYFADIPDRQNAVVAAALDWGAATSGEHESLHVVEVSEYRGSTARVVDHTQPGTPTIEIPISRFEGAIRACGGGLLTVRKVRIDG